MISFPKGSKNGAPNGSKTGAPKRPVSIDSHVEISGQMKSTDWSTLAALTKRFSTGWNATFPPFPFWDVHSNKSSYSLDCPDELLALRELDVDEDEEESESALLGPALGQQTLQ